MTIYVTRNFGTFGKDTPTLSRQSFYTPRFGGRAGGIVSGVATIGRFITRYKQPITKIGSAVAGSAIAGVALDEAPNQFKKTLRTAYNNTGTYRYGKYKYRSKRRCPPECRCTKRSRRRVYS